jgi:hypothetical protein
MRKASCQPRPYKAGYAVSTHVTKRQLCHLNGPKSDRHQI